MPGCDEATRPRLVPLHLCRTAGRALPRSWAVPAGGGVGKRIPRRHVEPGVPPGVGAGPPPARLGLRTLLRRRRSRRADLARERAAARRAGLRRLLGVVRAGLRQPAADARPRRHPAAAGGARAPASAARAPPLRRPPPPAARRGGPPPLR